MKQLAGGPGFSAKPNAKKFSLYLNALRELCTAMCYSSVHILASDQALETGFSTGVVCRGTVVGRVLDAKSPLRGPILQANLHPDQRSASHKARRTPAMELETGEATNRHERRRLAGSGPRRMLTHHPLGRHYGRERPRPARGRGRASRRTATDRPLAGAGQRRGEVGVRSGA